MKKRNKKYVPYKPKPKSIKQQIKMVYGDKKPYCMLCEKDCILASEEDVKAYKTLQDPNYPFDFIFIPDCECYIINDEWMGVK